MRKNIKNLHLGVYPPTGRVRVAAPFIVSDEAVRLAVIGKLGWIRRQQASFERQPRETEREMVSGESHYFLGRRYRLHVVYSNGPVGIVVRNKAVIELRVRPRADVAARQRLLLSWHRQQLKQIVLPILKKWQKRLGVRVSDFGNRMKTKWGTCTAESRRIWINLELAKKAPDSIEYVVLHELVHLVVRHHDNRFIAIMDKHLPRWRSLREELNCLSLAHEAWRE